MLVAVQVWRHGSGGAFLGGTDSLVRMGHCGSGVMDLQALVWRHGCGDADLAIACLASIDDADLYFTGRGGRSSRTLPLHGLRLCVPLQPPASR
eukprot:gene15881-biopygen7128